MFLSQRLSPLGVAAFFLGLSSWPAAASVDTGYDTPKWTLQQSSDDQYNGQPFLNPSNDSRYNLLLLLLDEGHAKFRPASDTRAAAALASATPMRFTDLADLLDTEPMPNQADTALVQGEGSRCVSNEKGAAEFQLALAEAKDLPQAERDALSHARNMLAPTCNQGGNTALPPLDNVQSPAGRQFVAYLTGAAAFYESKFTLAEEQFSTLGASDQPWIKEAALYMLARVSLNQAQFGAFDNDDGLLKRDKVMGPTLALAGKRLQAYLDAYPDGKYASSARGLMRRVTWLGGDSQKLSSEFASRLDQADTRQAVEMTAEIDLKLMDAFDPATTRDPRLLAMWDLMQIRKAMPAPDNKASFELSALEAQKPSFVGHEELFAFLLAAHAFYDDNQPAKTLALLPAAAPAQPMSFLAFSRQVLRGLALEASGDRKGARKHWLSLLTQAQPTLQRPTVQLALALNYERTGEVTSLFAKDSPVRDTALRQVLLVNSADAGVLRQVAKAQDATQHERALATYTLLSKDLMFKRYRDFGEDLALMPKEEAKKDDAAVNADDSATGEDDPEANGGGPAPHFAVLRWAGSEDNGYKCPGIAAIAQALDRNPNETHSQICLGEFFRLSDPGDYPTVPADQLGGASKPFAGKSFARQDVYRRVIADRKSLPADRAYALFRAIHCYAPVGNNGCGGEAVPKRERANWFRTLKADYPKSELAQTPYYW